MVASLNLLARIAGAIIRRLYGFFLKAFIKQTGKRFFPSFPLTIKGGENIEVGQDFVSLGRGCLDAQNGYLKIGNHVQTNTNVQIIAAEGKISIGDNVLIGQNVVIRSSNHGIVADQLIRTQPHRRSKIQIEDDVWIGANSVILAGVTLGHGAIVNAGSVVTNSVEKNTIVGGVPARTILTRR